MPYRQLSHCSYLGMLSMNIRINRISNFLLKKINAVDHLDTLPKKTTIRTSSEQSAFISSIQSAMHTGASFNDAVSLVIDWAIEANNPLFNRNIGFARALGLFGSHNIPEVHINLILKALSIPPVNTSALSDGTEFAAQVGEDNLWKICKFFGVQRGFLIGETNHVHYVRHIAQNEFEKEIASKVREHGNFQPHNTLLAIDNMDNSGGGILLYLQQEMSVENEFLFKKFYCVGFLQSNYENFINSFADFLNKNWVRQRLISVSGVNFDLLYKGSSPISRS